MFCLAIGVKEMSVSPLTLSLLVAYFDKTKLYEKMFKKGLEPCQHDSVLSNIFCDYVLWTKVASALEGLMKA